MIIWVDAQLPPTLTAWIVETFGITALSLKKLGLRDAKDTEIFESELMNFEIDHHQLIYRVLEILNGEFLSEYRES